MAAAGAGSGRLTGGWLRAVACVNQTSRQSANLHNRGDHQKAVQPLDAAGLFAKL